MAIEALVTTDEHFGQQSRHDLESFLYVLFYICTFTSGPGIPRPKTEIPADDTMRAWFSDKKLSTIGWIKAGHMCSPQNTIVPYFSEYWRDFAPFAIELSRLCFPGNTTHPNGLTYDSMIMILRKAHDAVEEPILDPQMSTVSKGKRSNLDIGGRSTKKAKQTKRRD
jgi:hypothetical protein